MSHWQNCKWRCPKIDVGLTDTVLLLVPRPLLLLLLLVILLLWMLVVTPAVVIPYTSCREAALSMAKAQAARDWTPEYIPPTVIPTLQQHAKGQLLRKAAQVSSAMILSVRSCQATAFKPF
jgi:hypothetical protein